jgi:hypothetical protein
MGASFANLVTFPRDGETIDELTRRCAEAAELLGGRTHVVPVEGYVVCMPEAVDGFDAEATARWSAALSADGGRVVFLAVFDSDVLAVGLWTDGQRKGEAVLPEAWFSTEELEDAAPAGEDSWRVIADGLGVEAERLMSQVSTASGGTLIEDEIEGVVDCLGVAPHAALRYGYRHAAVEAEGARVLDQWAGARSVPA